ncbi:unnamed protein product [Soboliphyme baturini]|uniref:Uncharacterized protein n=1 Tax=Soboliphyme baturini TaxID=241478 RepID=A0A183J0W2_9BILA|nr:unnamed protein product [Soboliphyme baturini]
MAPSPYADRQPTSANADSVRGGENCIFFIVEQRNEKRQSSRKRGIDVGPDLFCAVTVLNSARRRSTTVRRICRLLTRNSLISLTKFPKLTRSKRGDWQRNEWC